jgi:hypothetical protein
MSQRSRQWITAFLIVAAGFCALEFIRGRKPAGSSESGSPFPARPECYYLEMRYSDGRHSKEYVGGGRRRLESYSATGELSWLHIDRPDKGISWSALSGSTVLSESPCPKAAATGASAPDPLVEWTKEGTAVLEGCVCIRFVGRYRISMPTGLAREELFIDAANGLPVRQVTYDLVGNPALVNERLAFNLQPPAPALFEVPEGHTVETSPKR